MLTGSNGLLGQKLIEKISRDHSFELIATSLGNCVVNSDNFNYYSLDVTNQEKINQFVSKHHPDAIINTAAVTNVDYCEQNKVQCDNVNVKAVEIFGFYHALASASYQPQLSHNLNLIIG